MRLSGKAYAMCMKEAFVHENLLPHTCMEIIERVYGKQAEFMTPNLLAEITYAMMAKQTTYPDMQQDCDDAVQEWCNSF